MWKLYFVQRTLIETLKSELEKQMICHGRSNLPWHIICLPTLIETLIENNFDNFSKFWLFSNFFTKNFLLFLALSKRVKFIKSAQGNLMLTFDGYEFYQRSKKGDRIYWSCSLAGKMKCKARITQIASTRQVIVQANFGHNHLVKSFRKRN